MRDLGNVFQSGGFDLLQQLVVDHNQLTSLSTITHLRNLRSLKACNNRLNDENVFAMVPNASGTGAPPLGWLVDCSTRRKAFVPSFV